MLRECELGLQQQIEIMKELDDKTEQMVTLGVAILGAEVAGTALLLRESRSGAAWFLAAAVALGIMGLLVLVDAYVGWSRAGRAATGPSLAWIAEKAQDPEWTEARHLAATIGAYPSFAATNEVDLRRRVIAHRRSVGCLLASVVVAAGGGVYLLR